MDGEHASDTTRTVKRNRSAQITITRAGKLAASGSIVMPRSLHRRCPPRFWLDLQPRPERVLGICKRLYAKQARSLSGWFRVSSGGRSCFNLMQPHSASLRGRHGWSAGHLAGSRLLASPACGVWAGESKQELSGGHPASWWSGRRGPAPRVAARDGLVWCPRPGSCSRSAHERSPVGCVQRMISFGERRSRLTGQRHGCVGQSRG